MSRGRIPVFTLIFQLFLKKKKPASTARGFKMAIKFEFVKALTFKFTKTFDCKEYSDVNHIDLKMEGDNRKIKHKTFSITGTRW